MKRSRRRGAALTEYLLLCGTATLAAAACAQELYDAYAAAFHDLALRVADLLAR